MSTTYIKKEFYGYKIEQNPSEPNLTLYMGALDAKKLSELVSVDNAVGWDSSSGSWKVKGRNRSVNEKHYKSILSFLKSGNNERILASPIVISIEGDKFDFTPHPGGPIDRTEPGTITIKGAYTQDASGNTIPVEEKDRVGWVLDGQHRIKAFREWSSNDPYPVNVVIIKQWRAEKYEDVMRHQTYELNMGRPLDNNFKAAIREQYSAQVGHIAYKEEISLSWIRKNLEERGGPTGVFSPDGISGGTNLRTPYILNMHTIEGIIKIAYDNDSYLSSTYKLHSMNKNEAEEVGKYLFDFYTGVRMSIGLLNPQNKGQISPDPIISNLSDYWELALNGFKKKQKLVHNVGLKAITIALLEQVMGSNPKPQSPMEVKDLLWHMRGIAWHQDELLNVKDDYVEPIARELDRMYKDPTGVDNPRTGRFDLNISKQVGGPSLFVLKAFKF